MGFARAAELERWADQRCRVSGVSVVADCPPREPSMRSFSFVGERDPDTGLYLGHVPGWPRAHTQEVTLDDLEKNHHEVVEMLDEREISSPPT